jgi:hypothetical protein
MSDGAETGTPRRRRDSKEQSKEGDGPASQMMTSSPGKAGEREGQGRVSSMSPARRTRLATGSASERAPAGRDAPPGCSSMKDVQS